MGRIILILIIFAFAVYRLVSFVSKGDTSPSPSPNTQTVIVFSPLPSPTSTTTPTKPTFNPAPSAVGDLILLDVPFTAQAPFAEWSDPRQEDACEEASVVMAMHWVKGEPIASKQAAKGEILALSQYQTDKYGDYHDTSAQDTAERLIKGYYKYNNYEVKIVTSAQDLINELPQNHLIIIPANGRALGNPHFTPPGPERHNLVVKGYDPKLKQFITNDPGIWQGESYRYSQEVLFNALRDYPTGFHVPIVAIKKVMIVIRK